MKAFVFLLFALLPFAMSGEVSELNKIFDGEGGNINLIFQTTIANTNVIYETFFSFDRNTIKAQVTTDDEHSSAQTLVANFTEGVIYGFDNSTKECEAYFSQKFSIFDYATEIFENNTTFVGERGRNLYVFQVEGLIGKGSMSYIYGVFNCEDGLCILMPRTFQNYFPNAGSYSGQFLDDMYATEDNYDEDFYIPECEGVKQSDAKLNSPLSIFVPFLKSAMSVSE